MVSAQLQVAVSRVEHVADAQPHPRLERTNPFQHFREPGAGHHAILHVIIRRHPPHRGERGLARTPQQRALRGVRGGDQRRERRQLGRDVIGHGHDVVAELLDPADAADPVVA